jgi:hypothetical protein
VRSGASTRDVLALCGLPDERVWQQQVQWVRVGDAFVPNVVFVERWTYDLGPNQFVRALTFRNGVLGDVSLAGYGER